jgi:diguanylate cyclase (GGDEF)-like protein
LFFSAAQIPDLNASAELPVQKFASLYSTEWFGALCVVLLLALAIGILWLRFVGAQRRERELRQLVAQKTADLQQANDELFFLSFTDPLTSLANRRLFDKLIERECGRIQRMNSFASLLSIDVDHFKQLNDTEGHQKGDECLVALGGLLTKMCRRKLDLAARYGGEEFAMILPITNSADAERIAESIRQAIADLKISHPASPVAPYLTVSIGVATANKDWCCTPEALVAAADRALYEAKRRGRNRVCLASPTPDDELGAPNAS